MLICHKKISKTLHRGKNHGYFVHSISQTFAPGNPLTEPLLSWSKRETLIDKCKLKKFYNKTYKKNTVENSACKKLRIVPVFSSEVL